MKRGLRLSDLPDRLTIDDFWAVIGQIEHEQLDFKEKPVADIQHTIAAMSMTDGGLILLGISNKREIKGCRLNQQTLDTLMKAAHACGVDAQPRELLVGNAHVTIVAVPEVRGRIVTTADGRLLRRVGSENQPLLGDSLARFVAERTNRSSEEDAIALLIIDEIDLELLNRALNAAGQAKVSRSDLMRGLTELGVAKQEAPPAGPVAMNAAGLLFARDPRKYISGASVQLVRRVGVGPGPSATQDRTEVVGPIPEVLDRVISFVESHTTSHEAVIGKKRERLPEYPPAVLREAVLNALAHRDYGLAGATVDVTIWDDRVEVRSPGPLPGHITLENIRQEHYSRNRRIMHVLKLLGLVEEYGEGVDRMFREMESRLMEPPVFTATPASVTVTIRSRSLLTIEDQAWLALLGHMQLSPMERRLLVLARGEGSVTRRSVKAEIPDVDAEDLLSGAVAKGLLVRAGERGGARYVLSDEVVLRAGAAGVEARARQRQMLLDEMRRRESISTVEATKILGEKDLSLARHLLADLVRAGLASARGRTRARRYYPTG